MMFSGGVGVGAGVVMSNATAATGGGGSGEYNNNNNNNNNNNGNNDEALRRQLQQQQMMYLMQQQHHQQLLYQQQLLFQQQQQQQYPYQQYSSIPQQQQQQQLLPAVVGLLPQPPSVGWMNNSNLQQQQQQQHYDVMMTTSDPETPIQNQVQQDYSPSMMMMMMMTEDSNANRAPEMISPAPRRTISHNSTSSIYVSSTMRVPNMSEVLSSVSSVVNCLMVQTSEAGGIIPPLNQKFAVFDERYWASLSSGSESDETRMRLINFANQPCPTPEAPEVFSFLSSVFQIAQFSPECSTIGLVLLNRLLNFTMMPIHQKTWRLLLLCSLLIAQKIWDDRSLANVDFPIIWKHACPYASQDLSVKAVNTMELKYLSLLSYNVFVSSALYAKYYFELRALHDPSSQANMTKPLSKADADRLEARSAAKAYEFEKIQGRKSRSEYDLVVGGTRNRAVLS